MIAGKGKSILRLMRPEQWVKNLFVFLPSFFNGTLFSWAEMASCVWCFIALSFISSAVYCFNDIIDADDDRLHPVKRNRPVASGALSPFIASVVSVACLVAGFAIALIAFGVGKVVLCILIYLAINVLYSLLLKRLSLVDIALVAIGFVLRIIIGGAACDVVLSHWIVLMVFLLSAFLATAKRRDDVVAYKTAGVKYRKNVTQYNVSFLDVMLSMLSGITIISYIMYTVSPDVIALHNTDSLYITSIFVVFGLLRYLQITFVNADSGSPTRILLKDAFIQVCLLLWGASYIFLIYIA